MDETLKWSYIPMDWVTIDGGWRETSIINKGTMISHGIKIVCSLGQSKGHVIMKSMVAVIPLMEFNICSLELEYVI